MIKFFIAFAGMLLAIGVAYAIYLVISEGMKR
jgi:hypothetical protein